MNPDAARHLRRPRARLSRRAPDAADAASAARRRDRARHPRQAREPQPHGRVQGSRRPESHRQLSAERAARRDHRHDRQSRAVDRARVPARRRAVHDRRRRVGNNPEKNAAMRALRRRAASSSGATSTRRASESSSCSRSAGCATCTRPTSRCCIAGVGTYALEIFEEHAGRGRRSSCRSAAAAARAAARIVRTALGSRAQVIGVQAERADAFTRSWQGDRARRRRQGRHVRGRDGDARHLRSDLRHPEEGAGRHRHADAKTSWPKASGSRCATTHNLAEGAGAAALMAAMKLRERLAGKKRRLRDERRQHRPRDAGADCRRVTTMRRRTCRTRETIFLL